MSHNSDMINLVKLMEGKNKFAGEEVGQKPGDQVRGTDKAVAKGTDHPFKGRLVGEDTTLEDVLSKKYQDFKDVQAKEKEEKKKAVEEGRDTEALADDIYNEFEARFPRLARMADHRTIHAAVMDVLNYDGDHDPASLAHDVARAVKQNMRSVEEGVAEGSEQRVVIVGGPEMYVGKTGILGTPQAHHAKPGYVLVNLDHGGGSTLLPKEYVKIQDQGVAEEGPKNALGKALYRDLSKEKKASPQQVQRNKERWAQRQAERGQGVAEDQINEVDPRNYDSDWDYYDARARAMSKRRDDDFIEPDTYEPPEPQRKAAPQPEYSFSNDEDRAAGYNMVVTVKAPSTQQAEWAAKSYVDHHWGAKKQIGNIIPVRDGVVKVHMLDKHKYGMWTPWKGEEPIGKPLSFGGPNESLDEVSDETLTSYLTKVDADARKHRADPTKRSAAKRNKSVAGFSRAFNKLDARRGKGVAEASNPADKVIMDIPLMIRLFEYAREDAQTDMDLHNVSERLIKLSSEGRVLTMQDYDNIVGQQNEQLVTELGADGSALGSVAAAKSQQAALSTKPSPVNPNGGDATDTNPTSKPTVATTAPTTTPKPGEQPLTPDEQDALDKIKANAGLKSQYDRLLKQAQGPTGV